MRRRGLVLILLLSGLCFVPPRVQREALFSRRFKGHALGKQALKTFFATL